MEKAKKSPTIVLGVIHKGDEVLLIKRREKDPTVKNLIWAFPGGKLRSHESPEESLLREVKEEVGLDVEIKQLLFIRVYPGTQILQRFYECVPRNGSITTVNEPEEVEETRWVKASRVPEYFASDVHPYILGFLTGLSSKSGSKPRKQPLFEG